MDKLMSKLVSVYEAVAEKSRELDEYKAVVDDVAAKLDQEVIDCEAKKAELDAREKKISNVENIEMLYNESMKNKEIAIKKLTEAEAVAKQSKIEIEDEKRQLVVKQSEIDSKLANLESQQKSLNDEAARLESDRKQMKNKVMQELGAKLEG